MINIIIMETSFEQMERQYPRSARVGDNYKTLTFQYFDKKSSLITINLVLDETFLNTDDILEFNSILNGAYFLVETGLPEIVFFGGSLIKNSLDIKETKIDDFDTGYFDTNTKRGEKIVLETIKKITESGDWQILDRSASKITLPLAQQKVDFFLESGAQAFLTSSNPYFAGKIFEFGNEDTLESTLNMENISATLKLGSVSDDGKNYIISCSLRGKNIQKSLEELRLGKANINRNVENFNTKFDILQRFLLTTIKYNVSFLDDKDPESALYILKHFGDNDFVLPKTGEFKKAGTREDLIILEKRKEFCLNKFFNLLTRITPLKREIYLHDLIESKILVPFLPEVHEVLSNQDVRKKLLSAKEIKGALPLYNFITEVYKETKEQKLSTTQRSL